MCHSCTSIYSLIARTYPNYQHIPTIPPSRPFGPQHTDYRDSMSESSYPYDHSSHHIKGVMQKEEEEDAEDFHWPSSNNCGNVRMVHMHHLTELTAVFLYYNPYTLHYENAHSSLRPRTSSNHRLHASASRRPRRCQPIHLLRHLLNQHPSTYLERQHAPTWYVHVAHDNIK
jgi:hypothetical protein